MACGIDTLSPEAKNPCPNQYQPDPYLRTDPAFKFEHMYPTRKPQCALCDNQLPKGRRRWCSDECGQTAASRFFIRKGDSNAVRNALLKRDAGVCADCGEFCELQTRDFHLSRNYLRIVAADGSIVRAVVECPLVGHFQRRSLGRKWEGHHIVAVTEGGGGCDLDGYITLCTTCHGKHTGALRKRLNKANAPQMEML